MFGSLPTPERLAFEIRSWGSDAGYGEVFKQRWSKMTGVPGDAIDRVLALPAENYKQRASEIIAPYCMPVDDLVAHLTAAGVRRTVVHGLLPTDPGLTNDDLAEATAGHTDHFLRFARVDPTSGNRAAAEVKRCVNEYGFRGTSITPFWHNVQAHDPVIDPLYATCQDLGVPVWIHTSMNWVRTTKLDREHPLYLDDVAARYPDLVLIAGHAGWPWITDMVAVAQRHPGVYIDVSAYRPKHLNTPGTGWEMLRYYMQRTLQTKVLYGTTWTLLGMTVEAMLDDAASIGLPDEVLDRWLYRNAARIFDVAGD